MPIVSGVNNMGFTSMAVLALFTMARMYLVILIVALEKNQ